MRETFKKIGDAKSSDSTTKELQKPLKASYLTGLKAGGESDAVERFLAATRPPPPPQPFLSQPCRPTAAARLHSRHRDDYETLKTMYKLSLVR